MAVSYNQGVIDA